MIWQAGAGAQDLGTLPGTNSSEAHGVNARGQVVGWSGWNPAFPSPGTNTVPDRAFLWQAGTGMQNLGTLPGADTSKAYAINDSGQVVGESGGHAVLWRGTSGIQDLGTLGDTDRSAAGGINNQGQVVGESAGHAVLWQPMPAAS